MTDRFVVLAVSTHRSGWFADVGRWSHAGAIPVDCAKCLSVDQLRVRLRSGRPHSAALLDANATGVDRDVIHELHDAGVAALIVGGETDRAAWLALGADAVLTDVSPDALLQTLRAHAAMVPAAEWHPPTDDDAPIDAAGRVIAVCGPGGTGVSTIAAAIAQQLGGTRAGNRVLLADLCLRAEQGVLHDAGDIGPGVQELVDQSRTTTPSVDQVRAHTYAVPVRSYALLLGLRAPAAWTTLRPRAVATALVALRRAFDVVVCDTDGDFEGQADTGSSDLEERNAMSRGAARGADTVIVVGAAGLKGVYSVSRVINEAVALGVDAERIVPLFNRTRRSSRSNSKLAKALLATLPTSIAVDLAPPVFVAERDIENVISDVRRLPAALGDPAATAVNRLFARLPVTTAIRHTPAPKPIVPGSLATEAEELAAP